MSSALVRLRVSPAHRSIRAMNTFIYTCSECGQAYRVRVERSAPCDHDTPCCHHDEEPVDAY